MKGKNIKLDINVKTSTKILQKLIDMYIRPIDIYRSILKLNKKYIKYFNPFTKSLEKE